MLYVMIANTFQLYWLLMLVSVAAVVVAIYKRKPMVVLAIHALMSVWVLVEEYRAAVPDRDAIFLFGVFFRLLFVNAFVLCLGQSVRFFRKA